MSEFTIRGASVARGATYFFIRALVASASGLVYYAFASKILSVTEIGVVSVLAIIESLLATFCILAIPSATTKYIAEYLGRERPDIIAGIYKTVLKFGLVVSFISSFLCFVAANPISLLVSSKNIYEPLIQLMAIDVFALLLSPFFENVLLGLGKFRNIALVGVSQVSLRYFSSLFFIILGYGLMGVLTGWVIGDFFGLGLFFVLASRSVQTKPTPYPLKELAMYSAPLWASATLSYFVLHVDHFVILFFAGVSTLGIYSVALTATSVLGLVYSSLGGSLFPQLAELSGRHGKGALKLASIKVSRYIFLVFTPLAVGLAVTAYPVILLFFGPQYQSGVLSLTIVSFAMALTCASVAVENLLLSLGSTRTFLEANVLAASVGTLFSIILVSQFGSTGAALAKALQGITLFVYPAWRLRKIFGIFFDTEAFAKSWLGSLTMAVAVTFIGLVFTSALFLPLYIIIGGVVYVTTLRLVNAVKSEDFLVIKQLLPNRFQKTVDLVAKLLT